MKRDKLGRFIKGQHYSLATQFKKGEFSREKHPLWKGGRRKTVSGYIMINVSNHPKAYRNEVYEHIVIAEKKLGRYLLKGECVHHINGIKNDNRKENIMVFPSNKKHISQHSKYHLYKNRNYLPEPKIINEKASLEKGRTKIVKQCLRCKKLFWTKLNNPARFCSQSCGILRVRYDK